MKVILKNAGVFALAEATQVRDYVAQVHGDVRLGRVREHALALQNERRVAANAALSAYKRLRGVSQRTKVRSQELEASREWQEYLKRFPAKPESRFLPQSIPKEDITVKECLETAGHHHETARAVIMGVALYTGDNLLIEFIRSEW